MDKNRFLVIKSKVLFSTINAKKSRSELDFSLKNKKIIISTQNDKKINPKGYTSTLVKKKLKVHFFDQKKQNMSFKNQKSTFIKSLKFNILTQNDKNRPLRPQRILSKNRMFIFPAKNSRK